MYLVYPDGCSGVHSFALCYVFGVLAGAASIWLCLLLQLSLSFKIFYLANFVGFWMAFLDPDSPMRTAPDSNKWTLCGFEFADWGSQTGDSGVFSGVMSIISGASLATIAALLPYPMTSVMKARKSAVDTVRVLKTAWVDAVAFYVAEDRDERVHAKMVRSMTDMKHHVSTLQEQLDATSWEMNILWYCGRSWRLTHTYLTELETVIARCLDRLSYVAIACMKENFSDAHDEFVKPERCGKAVEALVRSANDLFSFTMECVEDGNVGKDEREKLLRAADGVGEDVAALTRQMKRAIQDINKMELRKRAPSTEKPNDEPQRSASAVFQDMAEELNDEQIFMFSLCDFAGRVQRYSKWLAEESDPPAWHARDLFGWFWNAGFLEIVNKDAIMSRDNINFTLRYSISIFAAFAVSYVGYSEIIPARGTIIPCTVCVLLSQATTAPIKKSLGRLQGVVVGKFAGLLAWAMLGWCASWAQASISAIVFSYVFLFLFMYHYTSPFSYLGCLAAAFGTREFLQGCSAEVVGSDTLAPQATYLAGMIMAIALMTIIDLSLQAGLASDLAYVAYLDAWKMCYSALEKLLLTGDDVQLDLESILAAIKRAEALADEAKSDEPRLWKPPFPGDLFSEMIQLATNMRTQVVCILSVVCESAVVYGKERHDGTSSFSKKKWFKEIIKDEDSGWPDEIGEVFEEMEKTIDVVKEVAAQNGQTLSIDMRLRRHRHSTGRKMKLARRDDSDDETVSLVDSKMTQTSFVYGCLQNIKDENVKIQLAVLQRGLAP
jgi:hypothetical protein